MAQDRKEYLRNYMREWRKSRREQINARARELYDPEKRKKYAEREDKQKKRDYFRVARKYRWVNDPQFRMRKILRNQLENIVHYHRMRGWKNGRGKKLKRLGLTSTQFIEWIESQFREGMEWENYGSLWEFDHIFPLDKVDLTVEFNVLVVQNYRNIRAILKEEHKAKRTKIFPEAQQLFEEIEVSLSSLNRLL